MVEPQATPPGQGVVVVGVMHIPPPLQVGAARSCAFAHDGVPQLVPDLARAHAPRPSHDPSFKHGAVVETGHLPCDEPPSLIGRHRPLAMPVSTIAQELHVAVHALSQQMLPTQLFDPHWLLPLHEPPFVILGAHTMLRQ
jgi:hypothetical protein